jgi:HEAT repeat protein
MIQGWFLLTLLWTVVASDRGQVQQQAPDKKQKPVQLDSPEAIAKALKELDAPKTSSNSGSGPQLSTGSLPPNWASSREYLAYNYYLNCRPSMELLARTKAAIDKDLLDLARSDKRFQVRYRAMNILAHRGNRAVLPLAEAMQSDKDPDVRFLGWDTYNVLTSVSKLGPPKDIVRCVKLYESEDVREVREQIESFFGTVKASEAVQSLMESVKRRGGSYKAIQTLGVIGDPRSVPVIIKDFSRGNNRHNHLDALGKIATPEAVDFIIQHLEEYGAVEALCETRSEKALPALRARLDKLNASKGPDHDLDESATRIAVVRMSHKNPQEELLRIGEDKREGEWARSDALMALRGYDTTALKERILKLFISDPSDDIKRFCIWLLEDSSLPGIKDAMVDYALALEPRSMGALATEHYLLESLNKRLDTMFWDMADMKAYLKELRTNKQK